EWDRRLVHHLVPQPLWLGFVAHAVGRSDRTVALEKTYDAFDRALAAAKTADHRDHATLAILSSRAREQAVVLARLGDRKSVRELLEGLRAIDADDPIAKEIESRFEQKKRGGVDVAGLIQ